MWTMGYLQKTSPVERHLGPQQDNAEELLKNASNEGASSQSSKFRSHDFMESACLRHQACTGQFSGSCQAQCMETEPKKMAV